MSGHHLADPASYSEWITNFETMSTRMANALHELLDDLERGDTFAFYLDAEVVQVLARAGARMLEDDPVPAELQEVCNFIGEYLRSAPEWVEECVRRLKAEEFEVMKLYLLPLVDLEGKMSDLASLGKE